MLDLFAHPQTDEQIDDGAFLFRGFANAQAPAIIAAVETIAAAAPFRHMVTPGGHTMSAAMTSCGIGWVTDRRGYRYQPLDPISNLPWPPMPEMFATIASTAAAKAGFANFTPDACLINRYAPGAKMSLHQDKDERNLTAPVVSISLGLPATFLWGGNTRAEKPRRVTLSHGDVLVWGGASRLKFHGILPPKNGGDGASRINLTFRRAF